MDWSSILSELKVDLVDKIRFLIEHDELKNPPPLLLKPPFFS